MKIQTPVFRELRGKLQRGKRRRAVCYKTYKWGIVVIKNPEPKKFKVGFRRLFPQQLHDIARLWRMLPDDEKARYKEEGNKKGMTGYSLFTKEQWIKGKYWFFPYQWIEVNEYMPDHHFGMEEEIILSDMVDDRHYGLLRFWLREFRYLPLVSSFKVWLYSTYWDISDPSGKTIAAYRNLNGWNGETVTWNTRPDPSGTPTDSFIYMTDNAWYTLDLTSDVQAYQRREWSNLGWTIRFDPSETEEGSYVFLSRVDKEMYQHLPLVTVTF